MNDETGSSESRGRILPAVVLGVVLLVGTVVAGAALAGSTDDGPSGETILENAHHQYESADTLTGTANVTVSNATESRSATVEYAAARPDSARMTVTHDGTTVSMGTNATVAWVSAPAVGVERAWNIDAGNATDSDGSSSNATEACVAARSHADTFAANHTERIESAMADAEAARPNATGSEEVERLLTNPDTLDCDAIAAKWADAKAELSSNRSEANVSVSRTGSTTVDGADAYVVAIEPENESIDANATVLVAKNDSRVLETRLTEGANATVVRYDDQHFNVSMDDSTFAPPAVRDSAGTATYDDFDAVQSNTDRDLPTLDADGYAFSGAVVTHAGSGTTVAQRYAEGSTNATLVSTDSERVPYDALDGTNVTVRGHDATVTTMEGRSVVAWTDGDTTYALVTNGPTDDATALARTVSE